MKNNLLFRVESSTGKQYGIAEFAEQVASLDNMQVLKDRRHCITGQTMSTDMFKDICANGTIVSGEFIADLIEHKWFSKDEE
jgi:hypothetical protein